MLETGKTLCYKCGHVDDEAWYSNGQNKLVKLCYGRGNEFAVGVYTIQNHQAVPTDQTATLANPPTDTTMPSGIMVRFGRDAEPEAMFRVCLHCLTKDNETTKITADLGRYPTYVLALIGPRTVGKSTWVEAIANMNNLFAVNNAVGRRYSLSFHAIRGNQVNIAATDLNGVGSTNVLQILEHQNGQAVVVANIILFDAAGENYTGFAAPNNRLRPLLVPELSPFGGADAYLFFESAGYGDGKNVTEEERQVHNDVLEVFNNLHQAHVFGNKPVAQVFTKTDELLAQPNRIPRFGNGVPVMSPVTFSADVPTSYHPEKMLPRMAYEDAIAKGCGSYVLREAAIMKKRGFMVQSCRCDKNEVDLERNFNVMDPLLWVLSELKLFPLC